MSGADWETLVDVQRLAAWMDLRGLGSGPIEHPRRLAGGTQNLLLHFRRAGRDYVLRRPPLHPRQDGSKTIAREARVLGALAGTSVPHAALIAACDDASVLGAGFYLMEPVAGFNASAAMPALHASDPGIRRQMGYAMVDALLRLGEVDYRRVGLEGFGKPEGFLQRQVSRWLSQLEGYRDYQGWPGAERLPGVRTIARWLEQHCPTQFSPGILHGDYHLNNVMFSQGTPQVAAIVDWELATIGDPLLDLGWLLVTWPGADGRGAGTIHVQPWEGFPTAQALIERYRSGTARSLIDLNWYIVLAGFKLGILLEGSYARACAGKSAMETALTHHACAVRLFEQTQARLANDS
ncbi:phosphotransferase family protein [Pseudomonas bohemica]|uniref:phosphotransferase family protein n=1 Tax=Pseudomonas bohemica TaxID=2044872 RepID=UPI000DA6230F|nr:phosphotransferase family protein [Pseudomonas bohemica]